MPALVKGKTCPDGGKIFTKTLGHFCEYFVEVIDDIGNSPTDPMELKEEFRVVDELTEGRPSK